MNERRLGYAHFLYMVLRVSGIRCPFKDIPNLDVSNRNASSGMTHKYQKLGLNMSGRVSLERSPSHILGSRRRLSLSTDHNQTVGDDTSVLCPRRVTLGWQSQGRRKGRATR
jgi:hypothetical protein